MKYWTYAENVAESAHTLIAGATGSGKSVVLNNIIHGIIVSGKRCAFTFIDLKRVELSQWKNTGRTLTYAYEEEDAISALDHAIKLMEQRFEEMEAKNLKKTDRKHLYIVIDELADLVRSKEIMKRLVRIGRLGRAAGIHMICATQDPSRATLDAQLMQNFTLCFALRCRSAIESRQIIGIPGAEKLPKHGKAIMFDADGYKYIDVDMTPQSDIDYVISELKVEVKLAPAPKTTPTPTPRPQPTPAVQYVPKKAKKKISLRLMLIVIIVIFYISLELTLKGIRVPIMYDFFTQGGRIIL